MASAVTLQESHYQDHPAPQSLPPLRCLGRTSNYLHPLQPVAVAIDNAFTIVAHAGRGCNHLLDPLR